ncbi:non-canonical purine NTP pyrophosphatase, partial [Pseudomonas aeruginosa]
LKAAAVIATKVLGYCDGREIRLFEDSIEATVQLVPAGPTDLQWDCVVVPNGHTQTFAEMGSAKEAIPMRPKAIDKFTEYLKTCGGIR